MRLKRLEMIGFKSFAQRTVIELNPGVTAVVGPNGCGKSNIVDALRWAMGEQSARHLRGHQMEDVVFNGSDSLPATGMAEVSLIFDNEDGRAPVEYNNFTEIMVTRRLFRSGESEYAINKVPCRLKDVIELFLGTGVGSKAYSIVEQGRVDELVNSKPEERRALIEEAAGTSKYKSRKLVAERKLERTQQNLLRVADIVREIERQIRTMELQAKKAERYRTLKAQLKEKDLLHAVIQQRGLNEEISGYESQLTDAENRFTEYVTALHSKEAESEAVRLALMEAEKEISGQQETVYRVKGQIQTEEQRIDFYRKDLLQLSRAETETHAALLQLERLAVNRKPSTESRARSKPRSNGSTSTERISCSSAGRRRKPTLPSCSSRTRPKTLGARSRNCRRLKRALCNYRYSKRLSCTKKRKSSVSFTLKSSLSNWTSIARKKHSSK